MVLWITCCAILMNLILAINSLNFSANGTGSTTKRVSAAIIGDFKIGFLVSVRLHNPGRKSTRNLECGKVSWDSINPSIVAMIYPRERRKRPRQWKLCWITMEIVGYAYRNRFYCLSLKIINCIITRQLITIITVGLMSALTFRCSFVVDGRAVMSRIYIICFFEDLWSS